MPISALTDHAAASAMQLATMIGNNQLIDNYLRGEVDPADFQDLIRKAHGIPGANHRLYIADGVDYTPRMMFDTDIDPADNTPLSLDRDCLVDMLAYGDAESKYWVAGNSQYEVPPDEFMGRWVFERLGNRPAAAADGTGSQLFTHPHSWHNWLFNAPAPTGATGWVDAVGSAGRFREEDYYDKWLTVPFASKRVWIPEACVLYVMAHAQGTWNHNMNPALERHAGGAGNGWGTEPSEDSECPAMFRLFIDHDNDFSQRKFSWDVNGDTWHACWSPIQDYANVGYGGNNDAAPDQGKMLGKEWGFSCASRATARVASSIFVPSAGYYNLSLKFNSRYFYGIVDGENNWLDDEFALGDRDALDKPGPINVARWDKSSLSAVAQFNRTSVVNDGRDAQF